MCGDPTLGKAIEKRIIWRELLVLELQEFDEEIERLSEVAHTLAADGGTAAHDSGEKQHIQQLLQVDTPSSPWWRLGRFFH